MKGNPGRDVAESDAVEGECDGAAEGEDVADVDGGEVREEGSDVGGGSSSGRRGEEQDANEGESGSEEGVPAWCARAGWAKSRDDGEEGDEDNDESGDECGFGGSGADEPDGLELVACG